MKRGKAQRLNEFMRRVIEQEAAVREMLRPDAAELARWLNRTV